MNPIDHACLTITETDEMKLNQTDGTSVEKWWTGICDRGKREKPREKPTQAPFHPPQNPHGVTETRTRDPSCGRRATKHLRHEAIFSNTTSADSFSIFFILT